MKVTRVEKIRSKEPVELPEPWLPAWREPDGEPITSREWSVFLVHTDTGIVGVGPATEASLNVDLEGFDPARVGAFWVEYHNDPSAGDERGVAGLEIALWDALGKAAGKPVHELLGGVADSIPVYAATSRLLDPEPLVDQVRKATDAGFDAVKVRLHRSDPRDDVAAVRAVRDSIGEEVALLADANQNNDSDGYDFWSRRTACRVARELDDLGLGFLEEPLPRRDVEGLARVAAQVDMAIAGGEHSTTDRDFEPHLREGAYDVLQPDVTLRGNMGIRGLWRTATVAQFFDRSVIPHVTGNGNFALDLAATLQVAGAVENVPMVEYPYDPPVLTPETLQPLVEEPLWIDGDGTVEVPDGPGLGVELDEDELRGNGEVVWTSS